MPDSKNDNQARPRVCFAPTSPHVLGLYPLASPHAPLTHGLHKSSPTPSAFSQNPTLATVLALYPVLSFPVMLDRTNVVNDDSQFASRSGLQQQIRAERQRLDEGEDSRVSTDSDLDLESEEEDDYRSTFSNLLMRKLVAIELVQQQQALRVDKLAGVSSLQLLAAAEDSYCAKMRRVSQWRESTLQSETQSETQSEGQSEAASGGFAIAT